MVRNEPIIPFDQGMKRPFFSFNSDITNKNSNAPIRTIQKDNYSNSLSVQENRILLVDDEPDLATLFRHVLERSQELFPNLEVDCFIKKPIPSNELVKIVKAKLNC